MIKRFVSALLGSLAAIWISVILLFILFTLFIAAIVSNAFQEQYASLSHKSKSILYIRLEGEIIERQTPGDAMPLFGEPPVTISEEDVIASLEAAADDDKIEGVYIDCYGSLGGLAMRYEIVSALEKFKESGKWIISYADTYTQADYYMACGADEVILNPVGMVDVHGLATNNLYFKNLLDKLGVEMQVIKVGTFKSAVEPFILDHSSEANQLQQQHFLDSMWETVSIHIAESREVTTEEVNMWADSMLLTFPQTDYLSLNVVSELKYRHELEKYLKEKCGLDEDDDLRLITPENYVMAVDIPHTKRNKNRIAVLYAVGDIIDSGDGGIVGDKMVPLIMKLKENEDIDGLVLRVNSGGGSAFASEQIWDALEQFKSTGRPFYVSMSDYAASGGYYISCGADKIYAEPVTLTGSIGIFGMIPCAKEFVQDKIGVNADGVTTNLNGNFPNLLEPMTPFQRAQMQREIERGYDLFTSRCAEGRNMPIDSIKAIAEGRVWDGRSALELGLVDRMGSLQDAISDMADELDFGDKYCIITYPNPRLTFWEAVKGDEVKARVKDNMIRQELGEFYEYYNEYHRLKTMTGVQARMPFVEIR